MMNQENEPVRLSVLTLEQALQQIENQILCTIAWRVLVRLGDFIRSDERERIHNVCLNIYSDYQYLARERNVDISFSSQELEQAVHKLLKKKTRGFNS